MLKWLLIGVCYASVTATVAQARQMVISVDDLPWVEFAHSDRAQVEERHRRLLAALDGLPAVGFVNEGKLVEGNRLALWRQRMLVDWLDAGFELGNHTEDHVDLHRVSAERFVQSIGRGERYLRPLLEERGLTLRWFRHPYLHTGMDASSRQQVDAHLAAHDYRVAPVTVDNGEWIYARAYLQALNASDAEQQSRLRDAYVSYMLDKVVYFEQAAQRQFERPIPQILLIHANALNADALTELLAQLRERGYTFIPMAAAVEDAAYRHADEYYGRGGISWLHRWALTDQLPRSHYAGEPTVADWVLGLAGVDGE